jgi:deazaflavin-dependent oxidoreductase (nitroreductase family)
MFDVASGVRARRPQVPNSKKHPVSEERKQLYFPGNHQIFGPLHDQWAKELDVVLTRWIGISPLVWLFTPREKGKPVEPGIVLKTIHLRTGELRSVVLATWTFEPRELIVCGSNYGGPKHPQWVHNLRAYPRCWVSFRRKTYAVMAEECTGTDLEQVRESALKVSPHLHLFLPEAEKSGRQITFWRLRLSDESTHIA